MSELRDRSTPSFRRRLVVAPRRRAHPLVRAVALAVRAVAVVGSIGGLALWILVSPAFALRSLEVTGNRRVKTEWVESALRPELGHNLLRLDLSMVNGRLRAHPWIRSVELRKRLPHHLRVEVVEHRAAALLQVESGLIYVSDRGELITPYASGGDEASPYLVIGYGEPMLDGREERDTQTESITADLDSSSRRNRAAELRRALEVAQRLNRLGWCEGLKRIEILGEEDYLLRVESLPFPVLVRADLPPWKARALDDLLPQILASLKSPSAIDLRFSGRIVVKGAAQPPRQETG